MAGEEAEGTTEGGQPTYLLTTWLLLGAAAASILGLATVRFTQDPDWEPARPGRPLPPDEAATLRDEPEMDDEYWPCTDCHEPGGDVNPERRALEEEHDAQQLEHGTLWCYDCHSAEARDQLHLADASPVSFDETWRLCTRCHGDKLEDWRAGVHGKRTGSWRGPKTYAPCVECHDPHSPSFPAQQPKPAPRRPPAAGDRTPATAPEEPRTEADAR